ncbi:hypothetical protein E5D57_005483 [Metarhizium anisopliae]|nr:hypothetical protein E5D57_005483 [Metarhizium anisopliae]
MEREQEWSAQVASREREANPTRSTLGGGVPGWTGAQSLESLCICYYLDGHMGLGQTTMATSDKSEQGQAHAPKTPGSGAA